MSMPMPMPMPMPMDNNGTNMWHQMPMRMSFYWGTDVVVLFHGWPGLWRQGPEQQLMYGLALVMVFFLAVGAEILSMAPRLKPRVLYPAVGALIHAIVFGIRMGLGYLVMLSVMSYNVGVFMAAVVGHAAGSFIVKYRALSELHRESELRP